MRLGDATTVTAVYYYYCNFLFDLMTFIEVTEFKVEGDAPLVIGTCPILTLLVQFFGLLYYIKITESNCRRWMYFLAVSLSFVVIMLYHTVCHSSVEFGT